MSNYVPFGEEWEKEIMKLPKKAIVELYRKLCIQQQQSKEMQKPTP